MEQAMICPKEISQMEQAIICSKQHVGSWNLSSRALRPKEMSQMEQSKHIKMELQLSLLIGHKTVHTAFSMACTCEGCFGLYIKYL